MAVGPDHRHAATSHRPAGRFNIESIVVLLSPNLLTIEESRACLETVWFSLAIDGRPVMKTPIRYLPGSHGPITERAYAQSLLPTVIQAPPGGVIVMGMHYAPEDYVPPDAVDGEPPPPLVLLTRSVDIGAVLSGALCW